MLKIFLFSILSASCAKPGADETSLTALGPAQNVTGSIRSETGAQSDMAGWHVVLHNKENLIARVAEVNAAGLYTFPQIFTALDYTLTLLSPTFVHQASLSQLSKTESQIHQFFKMNSATLPTLVHKGAIISFQDSSDVTFSTEWAWADASGVPTPLPAPTALTSSPHLARQTELNLAEPVQPPLTPEDNKSWSLYLVEGEVNEIDAPDSDGILNYKDPDIDNDGTINTIDLNDDGDEFPDLIDQDANGDAITDSSQKVSDQHFPTGIKWVVVKYEKKPVTGSDTFTTTLTFLTQLRENLPVTPRSVSIRGAASLFNGATVDVTNAETGETTAVPWDGLLLDDGSNEDGAGNDGLFGRKVTLTVQPVAKQMVFVELAYGTDEQPWADAYPYTFPSITPGSLIPAFDRLSNTVTVTQGEIADVFGASVTEFLWSLSIYLVNSEDTNQVTKVFTSGPISSTATTWSLGDQAPSILQEGQSYRYKVTAQVLDRIPGYPAYLIESALFDIPAAE